MFLKKTTYIFISFIILLNAASGAISEAFNVPLVGLASWYAEFSPGIRPTTANMEEFDHDAMTCAIWDVPFGTMIEVTNLDNGKKVTVRTNDSGPAKRLCRKGRVIDLTMGAFKKIADLDKGLVNVNLEILN